MSLRVENLTKSFGEHLLFWQLRFTIDGPAVLWAPSGWGKTTLLRILMGLEQPDSGRADGVGRVAAVFQEDRLCPQLTAVDNVLLVLSDGRAQRQDVQADFAFLGMEGEALTLPASRLSGGQKRRAALLRALWARADTRLFDEPFTGLDPAAWYVDQETGQTYSGALLMHAGLDLSARTDNQLHDGYSVVKYLVAR